MDYTVEELIETLRVYPPNMKVRIDVYSSGVLDSIETVYEKTLLDIHGNTEPCCVITSY